MEYRRRRKTAGTEAAGRKSAVMVSGDQPERLPRESISGAAKFLQRLNPAVIAVAGVILICLLSLTWTRGDRVLGNDSFGYLERVKQFRESLPTHFGDWWPFGYPLVGAAISRLGLSAYASLIAVAILSYGAIIACFWGALPKEQRGFTALLVLAAACCAPVCPLLLATILSEPLFSAVLFGLAISLSRWPSSRAIIVSVIMALGAFGVRYAGAFALGLVLLWALLRREDLKRANNRRLFLITYCAGVFVAAILCYLNYRYFGRVAGPQPIGQEEFSSWPRHLAEFCWGSVSALVSSGILRALGGISNPVCVGAGLAGAGIVAAYLFRVWKKQISVTTAAMVLLIVSYSLAVVSLRAFTPFDNLSSARTFLPVLFPIAYLVAVDCSPRFTWAVRAIASLFLAIGVALALRGMSPDIKPDTAEAKSALEAVLKPGHSVAVNGNARSLAAYFDNGFKPLVAEGKDGLTVFWDAPERWDPQGADFTVIARTSENRNADSFQRDSAKWDTSIARAVNGGQARVVMQTDRVILVERSHPISK
jgi:hypothetical protein